MTTTEALTYAITALESVRVVAQDGEAAGHVLSRVSERLEAIRVLEALRRRLETP